MNNNLKFKILNFKFKRAQALIIGILVIFAASISLAVAGALIATSQINEVINQKLSISAFEMSYGCLENTLMQMDRGNFNPPPVLNQDAGKCTIEISTPVGNPPTYQVKSTAEFKMPLLNQNVTKKIQASVSVDNGIVTLSSWQEIY